MNAKIKITGLILVIVGIGIALVPNMQESDFKMSEARPSDEIPLIDTNTCETKTATFALGCFWGVEARFGCILGVVRTRVGYAGGTTENPTYYRLGDHIEAVQIDYNPLQLSYEELLEAFWSSSNAYAPSLNRQYMSAIFYHDDMQKELAAQSYARVKDIRDVYVEILPAGAFHLAEDYHQKYYLQLHPELMKEFDVYTDVIDFVNSTAAARVNAYIGGCGTLAGLEREIDTYGLSQEGKEFLLNLVRKRQLSIDMRARHIGL